MEKTLKKIRENSCHSLIKNSRIFAPFADLKKIGLAVSGGADSVALARLVAPWCACHGVEARILHVNHGLRGEASDGDEKFVGELAWQLGVPCHAVKVRIETGPGVSMEMAARNARQKFFSEASALWRLDAIATGHHAGDVAETLLLRLLRGAGAAGLSGLRPRAEVNGVVFLRPLLGVRPEALREWLRENGFAWREDATNADETIQRNLVRNRVLPWLAETMGSDVVGAICQSAEILAEEDALLEEMARRGSTFHVETLFSKNGHGGNMKPSFAEQRFDLESRTPSRSLALQRRAVRAWLLEHAGAEAAGFEVVERVLEMLGKERGRLSVPGGEVVFEKDEIVFLKQERAEAPALRRVLPGETQWGGVRVTLRHAEGIVRERGAVGELPASASFSADALAGREIAVRSWRAGDRIRELGMKGHKKLQDIFTDAKVPFWQRSDIPVFCCDGEVIWLPGCRVAAKYAVKDEKRVIKITAARGFDFPSRNVFK